MVFASGCLDGLTAIVFGSRTDATVVGAIKAAFQRFVAFSISTDTSGAIFWGIQTMLSFLSLTHAVAWNRRTLSAVVGAGFAVFAFFIFTHFIAANGRTDTTVYFTGGAVLRGVADPVSAAGASAILRAGFAGFFLVTYVVSAAGTTVCLTGGAGFALICFADGVSADHRAFSTVIRTGRAVLIVVAGLIATEGFDTSFRTIFWAGFAGLVSRAHEVPADRWALATIVRAIGAILSVSADIVSADFDALAVVGTGFTIFGWVTEEVSAGGTTSERTIEGTAIAVFVVVTGPIAAKGWAVAAIGFTGSTVFDGFVADSISTACPTIGFAGRATLNGWVADAVSTTRATIGFTTAAILKWVADPVATANPAIARAVSAGLRPCTDPVSAARATVAFTRGAIFVFVFFTDSIAAYRRACATVAFTRGAIFSLVAFTCAIPAYGRAFPAISYTGFAGFSVVADRVAATRPTIVFACGTGLERVACAVSTTGSTVLGARSAVFALFTGSISTNRGLATIRAPIPVSIQILNGRSQGDFNEKHTIHHARHIVAAHIGRGYWTGQARGCTAVFSTQSPQDGEQLTLHVHHVGDAGPINIAYRVEAELPSEGLIGREEQQYAE